MLCRAHNILSSHTCVPWLKCVVTIKLHPLFIEDDICQVSASLSSSEFYPFILYLTISIVRRNSYVILIFCVIWQCLLLWNSFALPQMRYILQYLVKHTQVVSFSRGWRRLCCCNTTPPFNVLALLIISFLDQLSNYKIYAFISTPYTVIFL